MNSDLFYFEPQISVVLRKIYFNMQQPRHSHITASQEHQKRQKGSLNCVKDRPAMLMRRELAIQEPV